MKKIPIGVQLYSVRGDVAGDAAGTLSAIKAMGYEGVEFAGLHQHAPSVWKAMLGDSGLCAVGAHIGFDRVLPENLRETIDTYKAIGCASVAVAGLPHDWTDTLDGYRRVCSVMNLAAVTLAKEGMALGYHNHDFEFKFVENRIPYDLMTKCLTADVFLQLDIGNLYRGGIDGVAFARTHAKRLNTVHLKAYKADCETAVIGEDDISWTAALAACESAGAVRWYVVEHEAYANPPMVCIKQCLDTLTRIASR
ncbi:MAG: sugar phosphate isomerase/epimerase [Kiritimatiellaeota bacterium]|nr:sugar phosphate isomerase/epimerase [Kiritimatiellota bacterium]